MAFDVTTVVICQRWPDELAMTLESAATQTGVRVELMAVGQPDRAANALMARQRTLAPVRRLEVSTSRKERLRALNLAWHEGKEASFTSFMKATWLAPGAYAQAKTALEEAEPAAIAFSPIRPFGPESPTLDEARSVCDRAAHRAATCVALGPQWGFLSRLLFEGPLWTTGAALYRRDALKSVRGLDESLGTSAEAALNARLVRDFGAVYLTEPILHRWVTSTHAVEGGPSLTDPPSDAVISVHRDARGRWESAGLRALAKGLMRWL